ncbi:MAG TPA: CsbD family protein [Lysobacter sp.]|nr:CsbD family protein [Lysobacter sp.]
MDRHRKEGSKESLKGKVNEIVGDITDNPVRERQGRAQQDLGEKEKEYGEARDRARDSGADPR